MSSERSEAFKERMRRARETEASVQAHKEVVSASPEVRQIAGEIEAIRSSKRARHGRRMGAAVTWGEHELRQRLAAAHEQIARERFGRLMLRRGAAAES